MNEPTVKELLLYLIYEKKIEKSFKRTSILTGSINHWEKSTVAASAKKLAHCKKEFDEECEKLNWLRKQLDEIDTKIMVGYEKINI